MSKTRKAAQAAQAAQAAPTAETTLPPPTLPAEAAAAPLMPVSDEPSEAAKPPPAARTSKIETVMAMMRRPGGVDVASLSEATGWQAHSVRGAIAGHIKKKLGLTVATQKVDGRTLYRIEN